MTLCHDLCKNGRAYQFAVWFVASAGAKEAPVGNWRKLASTTLPSVCSGDAALSQITFDHVYMPRGRLNKTKVYVCFSSNVTHMVYVSLKKLTCLAWNI